MTPDSTARSYFEDHDPVDVIRELRDGDPPSARTEQGVDDFPAVHDETEKHARIALGWLRRTWSDDVLRRALKEDDEVTAGHAFAAANAYGALSSLLGHFLRSRLSPRQGVDLDEARITAAVYAALGAKVTTFSAPDPCVSDRNLFEKYNAMPGGIAATSYLGEAQMREIIVPALAAADEVRSRLSPGSESTDDEIDGRIEHTLAYLDRLCQDDGDNETDVCETRDAITLIQELAARRSVSATPDAPHDACEHSRDCIACGKRIEPANGLCFSCATTDPKVRTEASRATVPAPGGDVPADVERLRECWDTVRDAATSGPVYAEWQADNGGGDSHEIVTLDNHFRALPVPMLTEEQKRDVALVTRHAREHVEHMMDEIADEVEAACDRLDALASVSPHTEEKPHGD